MKEITLQQFRTFFRTSLSSLYDKNEIDSFFFILTEEYLNLKRIDVSLQPNFLISADNISILSSALEKLKKEIPIQYILGKTDFFGCTFLVNENTLIPRPETEELVSWILEEVETKQLHKTIPLSVLDIGTGTGCIPISLAKENNNLVLSAIDISSKALKTAAENAKFNEVSINFIEQDILKTATLSRSFDIIVSNPPYVRELEKCKMHNNVLKNEPHLALFVSDEDPLIFYKQIADLAKKSLLQDGLLFFEINQYLAAETSEMLFQKGFNNIEMRKDIFGNDRMIKASYPME